MTVYLLDVNLLLALSDPMHIHHEAVHLWIASPSHQRWATCPITENGYLRIAAHPNYPNRPGDVTTVFSFLQQLHKAPGHEFWPDEISVLDMLQPGIMITHAQVTDVYLLGLAVHYHGKLATLDQHIPVEAVRNGKEALEVIPV